MIIEDDIFEIWNKIHKRLIMHSTMRKKIMFIIYAKVRKAKDVENVYIYIRNRKRGRTLAQEIWSSKSQGSEVPSREEDDA